MSRNHSSYVSYMLRLWLENDYEFPQNERGLVTWRASLEDPHTQEMQVFPDLEVLFDFLLRETERLASGEDARLGEGDDVN